MADPSPESLELNEHLASMRAWVTEGIAEDPVKAVKMFLAGDFPKHKTLSRDISPCDELVVCFKSLDSDQQHIISSAVENILSEDDFLAKPYIELDQTLKFAKEIALPGLKDRLIALLSQSHGLEGLEMKRSRFLIVKHVIKSGWKPTEQEWDMQAEAIGDLYPDHVFEKYVTILGLEKTINEKLKAILERCSRNRSSLIEKILKICRRPEVTPAQRQKINEIFGENILV